MSPIWADVYRRLDAMKKAGIIAHPVTNCGLRDHLVKLALAGDTDALARLLNALPIDLPPEFARELRDADYRQLAGLVRRYLPGESNKSIAKMIGAAVIRVQQNRRLRD